MRVMIMDISMPHNMPSHTFWNNALKITPVSDDASIMLSPAMLSNPAWDDMVEQIATNIIGVDIRITALRKSTIKSALSRLLCLLLL